MANMPWLSVIVPVHDGERFLAAALDSILLQRDPELEVIAVDDHSTDGSAAILNAYRGRLNLRVLRPAEHCGWVQATNLALAAAGARFACFLHQDDLWLPQRSSKLRSLIAAEPGLELVIHNCSYVDDLGRRIGTLRAPLRATGRLARADLFESLLVQNFVAAPAAIFAIEAARRCGPLDPSLWYTADWSFWLALSRHADAYFLPETLAGFRVHRRSQTASRSRDLASLGAQLAAVLAAALDHAPPLRHPRSTPAAAELSVLVNCFLAALWNHDARFAARALVGLRPRHLLGVASYLRRSRVHERVGARLAMLLRPRARP